MTWCCSPTSATISTRLQTRPCGSDFGRPSNPAACSRSPRAGATRLCNETLHHPLRTRTSPPHNQRHRAPACGIRNLDSQHRIRTDTGRTVARGTTALPARLPDAIALDGQNLVDFEATTPIDEFAPLRRVHATHANSRLPVAPSARLTTSRCTSPFEGVLALERSQGSTVAAAAPIGQYGQRRRARSTSCPRAIPPAWLTTIPVRSSGKVQTCPPVGQARCRPRRVSPISGRPMIGNWERASKVEL